MSTEQLSVLLDLPDSELLRRLGSALEAVAPGAKPLSAGEERELGANWLARNRARLAASICTDSRIKAYRTSTRAQNRVQLAAAILDVLAALGGIVSPASVAVLLTNEGLESLCGPT
jgi:hypothetical protein